MYHIPEELLLEIFSLAVAKSPCVEYWKYTQRVQNLASFALVNSEWTSSARELLYQEVQVEGDDQTLKAKGEQIGRESIGGKTKWLTIRGNIGPFLEATGIARWKDVEQLLNSAETFQDTKEPVEFSVFAQFPRLESLQLNYGNFAISSLDPTLSFQHLRRLVFGDGAALHGNIHDCRQVFSPTSMPLLAHLSIDAYHADYFELGEVFSFILPQLTSLAISTKESGRYHPSLLEAIHPLPKLAHLSVNLTLDEELAPDLFSQDATTFELESLHLSGRRMVEEGTLAASLVAIAKGEKQGIKIGKVILYGSEEEFGQDPDVASMGNIEWRSGDSPPFADFDGK